SRGNHRDRHILSAAADPCKRFCANCASLGFILFPSCIPPESCVTCPSHWSECAGAMMRRAPDAASRAFAGITLKIPGAIRRRAERSPAPVRSNIGNRLAVRTEHASAAHDDAAFIRSAFRNRLREMRMNWNPKLYLSIALLSLCTPCALRAQHSPAPLTVSVMDRTRTVANDWFAAPPYTTTYPYVEQLLRFSIAQKREHFDWLVEGSQNTVFDVPTTSISSLASQGQLGLGGTYYAASANTTPAAASFRQGYLRYRAGAGT